MNGLTRIPDTALAEQRRITDVFRARGQHDARYHWFDAAHMLSMQELERRMLGVLEGLGAGQFARARILDVGCGTGFWLRRLATWGADARNLVGVELLDSRAAAAHHSCGPQTRIVQGSGATLPLPDASFDLVCQMLVFTSVLDRTTRQRMAAEMLRVLAPGGTILWYDYHASNPANPDVRGVGRREIAELFAGTEIRVRRVTLAPPLARAVAPRARLLYHVLSSVPWLRTHYLATIRRRAGAAGTERPALPDMVHGAR